MTWLQSRSWLDWLYAVKLLPSLLKSMWNGKRIFDSTHSTILTNVLKNWGWKYATMERTSARYIIFLHPSRRRFFSMLLHNAGSWIQIWFRVACWTTRLLAHSGQNEFALSLNAGPLKVGQKRQIKIFYAACKCATVQFQVTWVMAKDALCNLMDHPPSNSIWTQKGKQNNEIKSRCTMLDHTWSAWWTNGLGEFSGMVILAWYGVAWHPILGESACQHLKKVPPRPC